MKCSPLFARAMLLMTALLGASSSALAAGNTITFQGKNVWTVYAFGNAQAVSDAFRALSNFASSGTFQSLVSMIAVMGVLAVGAAGGFNPGMAKRFIGYVVGVFLVCYIFFGVSNGGPIVVNVEVIDSVDATWKAPVTVPAVVGIPASIISTAGFRMTEAIEASFAMPPELKMSKGAPFNLATAMLADARQARITDPNLSSSLAYYVQDCFTIGVAQGALQANKLITSTNFLNDIHFANKSVMVNTLLSEPKGEPDIVDCDKAWNLINTAVTAQGGTSAEFLKDASAWSKTPAMSVVNSAADATAHWASNGGTNDGASMVKQSAILSAFRGSYSQAAIQTGNSEFLTGLAMSQATEAQRTSWITGAEVFNKTMGYIFAVLQVFVYAITPLVLCAALIPGLGLALLKNFMQILLWLAIWQPMLAIVNFIIISMQQAELGGILSNGGQYGFTLANMGIISEKTANLRAAATFVGTMVPALAWAMVKGSVDFSRVIGAAVGENFAQGAANTMTTGNYSLNQASMDSFTANKHSLASSSAMGAGHSVNDGVGSRDYNMGGSKMPALADSASGVDATSGIGKTETGNTGTSTSVADNGSTVRAGTTSNTTSQMGAHAEGGGVQKGSGNSTGASTQAGANAGTPLKSRERSPGDGSVEGAPNLNDRANQSTPIKFGSKVAQVAGDIAEKVNLQVGGQMTAAGQRQESNTFAKTDTVTTSGGTAKAGTITQSGGTNGTDGETASTGQGYTQGDNFQVRSIAAARDRAQVALSVLTRGGGEGTRFGENRHSPLGDKANHLSTSGAVQQDVAKEKERVHGDQKELKAEVADLKQGGEKAEAANSGAAKAVLAKEKAAAAAAEAPAEVGGAKRLGEALHRVGGDAKDSLIDATNSMGKLVGLPDSMLLKKDKPEGTDAAATPPAPAAPAHAPENKHAQRDAAMAAAYGGVQSLRPEVAANQAAAHRAEQGTPAAQPGKQPDAKQANHERTAPGRDPQAAAAAAPNRDHDGHGKGAPEKAQLASQAGKQPDGRHAHGKQPEKQEERPQLAQQDQKRDERDREKERQQPVTPNSVGQEMQMAQVIQQPQQQQQPVMPPMAPPPDNAAQLAAAGQPNQQGNPAAQVNPFSGEKSNANESQMQGQIQLAEQRAERMSNQIRGVDGMLASAEGRKPSELPELINQARDAMRNA